MAQDLTGETSPDITCREVAEWTSAYLEAHVDDPTKIRIALHLAACAGCDAYVKQIVSIRDMLGRLPGTVVEPTLRDRLREVFSTRKTPPVSKP